MFFWVFLNKQFWEEPNLQICPFSSMDLSAYLLLLNLNSDLSLSFINENCLLANFNSCKGGKYSFFLFGLEIDKPTKKNPTTKNLSMYLGNTSIITHSEHYEVKHRGNLRVRIMPIIIINSNNHFLNTNSIWSSFSILLLDKLVLENSIYLFPGNFSSSNCLSNWAKLISPSGIQWTEPALWNQQMVPFSAANDLAWYKYWPESSESAHPFPFPSSHLILSLFIYSSFPKLTPKEEA